MADMSKTVFGDFGERPVQILKVETARSVYTVSIHEERGRKYAIVRGSGDRENVVVRDSDPRIGEHSLFDLPIADWVGRILDVGLMKTSAITAVTPQSYSAPPAALPGGYKVPAPQYFENTPEISQLAARGTRPGRTVAAAPMAQQVVVGKQEEPAVPYPERHVLYAENIGHLLRSLHRRDRILDDCTPAQRDRLRRALDDANLLLAQLRARLG